MRASEVKMADVVGLLDGIMARGSGFMANRTRAAVMAVYRWAISRPETGIAASPVWGTRPPLRKEYRFARDRVLSPEEILTLWETLKDLPWRPAAMLKMILLTGQRPGEVCSMEWSRIDGDLWTMPAPEYKGGRVHHAVLNAPALEALEEARDHAQGGPWIFPSEKAGPYRTRSLDQTVQRRLLPKMDVARWTPHDLRRTAFTQMGALGIPRQIRDRIAGHSDPSVGGRHYDFHDYLPEIREAMEKWGHRVEEILQRQN
jgi:integrase